MPLVELRDIYKIYHLGREEIRALDGVSLDIAEGEFCSIIGPSGSGKSTLMHILGCLDSPTSGTLKLDGLEIQNATSRQLAGIRNQKIGFVFQFFNLIPSLSALENLELPMLMAGVKPEERRVRADSLLDSVGLKAKGFKRPEELSGGEQQRVAVCLALVNDPPIILADEPTGNLDSHNAKIISSMLIDLATSHGKTVLVASHDPKVVEQFPRVYHMRDGAIQQVT